MNPVWAIYLKIQITILFLLIKAVLFIVWGHLFLM